MFCYKEYYNLCTDGENGTFNIMILLIKTYQYLYTVYTPSLHQSYLTFPALHPQYPTYSIPHPPPAVATHPPLDPRFH